MEFVNVDISIWKIMLYKGIDKHYQMSYFSSRLVILMRSGTPVDPPGDLPPFRLDHKLRRSKYVELIWSKLLQPRQKYKMIYLKPGGIVGCWSPHGLLCWLGGSTLVRLSFLLLRCSQFVISLRVAWCNLNRHRNKAVVWLMSWLFGWEASI